MKSRWSLAQQREEGSTSLLVLKVPFVGLWSNSVLCVVAVSLALVTFSRHPSWEIPGDLWGLRHLGLEELMKCFLLATCLAQCIREIQRGRSQVCKKLCQLVLIICRVTQTAAVCVEGTGQRPGFTILALPLEAMWSWAGHITSLSEPVNCKIALPLISEAIMRTTWDNQEASIGDACAINITSFPCLLSASRERVPTVCQEAPITGWIHCRFPLHPALHPQPALSSPPECPKCVKPTWWVRRQRQEKKHVSMMGREEASQGWDPWPNLPISQFRQSGKLLSWRFHPKIPLTHHPPSRNSSHSDKEETSVPFLPTNPQNEPN